LLEFKIATALPVVSSSPAEARTPPATPRPRRRSTPPSA
jgi:hypothetical protein